MDEIVEEAEGTPPPTKLRPEDILLDAGDVGGATPIHTITADPGSDALDGIGETQRAWLQATGFEAKPRASALLPAPDGQVSGVLLGVGDRNAGDPSLRPAVAVGQLAASVPAGRYTFAAPVEPAELAAVAWGLGAYRFDRYRANAKPVARALVLQPGVDRARVLAIVDAVWRGRALVDTPANDMGPAELAEAAREIAAEHGATLSMMVGDELLAEGFPTIHAVGRASDRPPRLIDIRWRPPADPTPEDDAAGSLTADDTVAEDTIYFEGTGVIEQRALPKVTLVGKGICFDTGGLDIKPASSMLLMKKDMGGAAAVLALGQMIMALKLPVQLRLILAVAENAISGNAFRPSDVITTRSGKTVEIGNTDAEGRLVLCDALTLADEEAPDLLATFATLTGAARVAVGPDLAPFYTRDDGFAAHLATAGDAVADPVWRMPLWPGYEPSLDSPVADMNNVSEGPFAGSVTAALFLNRFVTNAKSYTHFDIYGWRPQPRPLGPKGGEVNAARAMLAALESWLAVRSALEFHADMPTE